MTFQQFLLILWARRKAAIGVFLITVLTTMAISFLLPKRFDATTTLVLDVKSPDPISGVVLPGLMAPGYMATQVDIINSDRVAQKVVSLLKLDSNPTIQQQWQEATNSRGTVQVWLADLLQKSLDIRPSRESSVIKIQFSGRDPEFASAVANGFAKAYIDTTVELRVEPAKQYAEWFESQINSQRKRLDEAQQALSNFQQESGIVATDERLDFEMQRFNELSTQLTQAQAQGTDASSKQTLEDTDTLPEVMQNSLILQLKSNQAQLESKLKELAGNLGQNHPQYKRSLAELAQVRAKIKTEIANVASAIGTAGRVSQAKATEIQAALERQKQVLFDLKGQKDKINLLVRDVETAQRAYDGLSQRYNQTSLEAQSAQTNASILTPATPPLRHSSPRIFLNIVVACFLGGLLALALALVLELTQPKVRSADDLIALAGVPLLAQLNVAKLAAKNKTRPPAAPRRRNPGQPIAREV